MPLGLPYTQMFAGDVPVTEVHLAAQAWPLYFSGADGLYVIYDARIHYDQPITYNGLVLSTDATLTMGETRVRSPELGPTRGSPPVGETRNGTLEVGPTRPGRRVERAQATRVIRYTKFAVGPTRVASDIGMTRRGAMIGPTRVKRGK